MPGLNIGYARVSTDQQDLTAQRDGLQALGVQAERMYVDHGLTGTNRERPGLHQALAACRAGDTLVVTKLDRLARSLPDARDIVDDLTQREVKLNLGGSVHDPTDPVGRLLFNVLAMVAEFEADLIRARTREGMQLAKAKGRLRGKQPKLTPRQEAHLVALHRTGGHTSAPSTKRRRPTPLRPLPLHLRGDPAESLRPTGRFRRSWSLRLRKTRRADGPHVAPTGRAAEGSRGKRGFLNSGRRSPPSRYRPRRVRSRAHRLLGGPLRRDRPTFEWTFARRSRSGARRSATWGRSGASRLSEFRVSSPFGGERAA